MYCRLVDRDGYTEFHVSKNLNKIKRLQALCRSIPIDSEGMEQFLEVCKQEVDAYGMKVMTENNFGMVRVEW